MAARPISYVLAPALLALGTVLAVWNWYLQPERGAVSAVAILFLGIMTLALRLGHRRSKNDAARRQAVDSIRSGIVFAGLIMVCSLGVKLAAGLGAIDDGSDLSQRVTMVILGAFLVFTGNAMPKALTPLAAMRCDGARAQALQRFVGWTWVLTGLAYATVWIVLPVDVAEPVSLLLLVSGMVIGVAQMVRMRRAQPGEA